MFQYLSDAIVVCKILFIHAGISLEENWCLKLLECNTSKTMRHCIVITIHSLGSQGSTTYSITACWIPTYWLTAVAFVHQWCHFCCPHRMAGICCGFYFILFVIFYTLYNKVLYRAINPCALKAIKLKHLPYSIVINTVFPEKFILTNLTYVGFVLSEQLIVPENVYSRKVI